MLCTAARIPLFLSKPGCFIGVRPLPLLPVPHSRRECPGGSEAVLPGSCHSAEFSSLVIITRANHNQVLPGDARDLPGAGGAGGRGADAGDCERRRPLISANLRISNAGGCERRPLLRIANLAESPNPPEAGD